MLHILPCLEYKINSTKSPEDISTVLKSVTAPERGMSYNPTNTEFFGEINLSDFKIMSNINYRNSFSPVIVGNIRVEGERSVIEIKMCLHWFVRIFLSCWFGMAGFFFLIGLLYVLIEGISEALLLLLATMFLIFGQTLARSAFYIPAKKAIVRLEELLK